MICAPCANGRHCMSETCACQHRIPEKTPAIKQEVAQGSDKISPPSSDLLPPGPETAPIEAQPVSLPPTDDTDWPGGPVPQAQRVLLAGGQLQGGDFEPLQPGQIGYEPHTGDPDEDDALEVYYDGPGVAEALGAVDDPSDAVKTAAMQWGDTRSRCQFIHGTVDSQCVYFDGHQGDHRWEFEDAAAAQHQADVRKLLADARIAESELCLSTYTHALGQPPFRCEMHFGHTGPHRSSEGVAPFQWINTSGFTDYGAADYTGQAE